MGARIVKGDLVIVTSGKEKGKDGYVKRVLPKKNMLFVDGINLRNKKNKRRPSDGSGDLYTRVEFPINASNIMHLDPKTGKACKIGFKISDKGIKYRYSKKSGEEIPYPNSKTGITKY